MPTRPAYRVGLVDEASIDPPLRDALAALLAAILDEGPRYRGRAWRTIAPVYRALAFDAGGRPVGQASGFAVASEPDVAVFGLGDVAVDPAHRRRGLARELCRVATSEARRRRAGVLLAKTRPLRSVLGGLGYVAVSEFTFYYEDGAACLRHPDWMAAIETALPRPVRLAEGDF